MVTRNFGNVRELPSGRFQARYRPLNDAHVTAPQTFDTPEEAREWLAKLELDAEAKLQAKRDALKTPRSVYDA